MLRTIIICLLLNPHTLYAQNLSNADITESLKNKVRMVQHLALNPLVIKAVQKQNAQEINKEIIKNRIDEWNLNTSDTLKGSMFTGDHAILLKRFIDRDSAFREAFLTDKQGLNVAAYPLSKNYWHGDKDLWTKSYNNKQGQIYISPLEQDQKTSTIFTHVSAPVLDQDQTIGVLVVGIRLGGIKGSSR